MTVSKLIMDLSKAINNIIDMMIIMMMMISKIAMKTNMMMIMSMKRLVMKNQLIWNQNQATTKPLH